MGGTELNATEKIYIMSSVTLSSTVVFFVESVSQSVGRDFDSKINVKKGGWCVSLQEYYKKSREGPKNDVMLSI